MTFGKGNQLAHLGNNKIHELSLNLKASPMKMMCLSIMVFVSSAVFGQAPIDVYKGTRKIAPVSEDTFYFSFAKGDQVLFDFESSTGRDLMEFEVFQYPQISKFRKDNQVKMKSEKLTIEQTGVYWFRMANRSGTERNIKLHIWRVPGSASTKNFNTTVKWKTVSDTTYTSSTEKYVTRRDTNVINREVALSVLSSQTRYGSNTQSPEFELPGNIIAWSYYIGVNKPGQQVFQDAEQKFLQANTSPKFPGYGSLAAYALTGKSSFTAVQNEQQITYSIVDAANVSLARQQQPFKSFRSKKASNDFSVMKEPREGKLYFFLKNETDFDMNVMVKIAAIVVYERWSERSIQKPHVGVSKIPIVAKP